MRILVRALAGVAPLALAACGGAGQMFGSASGGNVAPTTPAAPTSPGSVTPMPQPNPAPLTPAPVADFTNAEYDRSVAAKQMNASVAYAAGASGKGVITAVVDSGLANADKAFEGRIHVASTDVTSGTRGYADTQGHGTAVTQVLAAARDGAAMHGVAYDATVLALKAEEAGSCTGDSSKGGKCLYLDPSIAKGIQVAAANGARVVNISLGGSTPDQTLRNALSLAVKADMVVVIAAGNDYATDKQLGANPDPFAMAAADPAFTGSIIIVGATDDKRQIASFSNRAGTGAMFYVTARGSDVVAADHTGNTFLWDGTSFSAPVISGAVAVLAQAFPKLSSRQLVDLVLTSTIDLGEPGIDPIYGRGEFDFAKAFAPRGSTSLSANAVPVSLSDNGTLSAPMGDAGARTGASFAFKDAWQRDYTAPLGATLGSAARAARLSAAIDQGLRTSAVNTGALSLAFSIERGQLLPVRLNAAESRQARVLAGHVAMKLDARTQVGFAFGQGLSVNSLASVAPAMLLADRADSGAPLSMSPDGGAQLRHALGDGWTLNAAIEAGSLRPWRANTNALMRPHEARDPYAMASIGLVGTLGGFDTSLALSRLQERSSLLGARFGAALGGSGGTSWLGDVTVARRLAGLAFEASYRRGVTDVARATGRNASTIDSEAWALTATAQQILTSGDSLSFRFASPLRVVSGGLDLTGLSSDGAWLALSPSGRERVAEVAWSTSLLGGSASANLYQRVQPGHVATAPTDRGVAVRWRAGF